MRTTVVDFEELVRKCVTTLQAGELADPLILSIRGVTGDLACMADALSRAGRSGDASRLQDSLRCSGKGMGRVHSVQGDCLQRSLQRSRWLAELPRDRGSAQRALRDCGDDRNTIVRAQ